MLFSHTSLLPSNVTGNGGDADGSSVVIDDDWVVRKLAQIRRRSRNIDSAIPLSDLHVPRESATTLTASTTFNSADLTKQAALGNAPAPTGGVVTLQPILPRTKPSDESPYAERNDKRQAPLPPLGEGAVDGFPSASNPSGGQHQNGNSDIERTEGAVGQEGSVMVLTPSSESSDIAPSITTLHDGHSGKSRNSDEVATSDDGGDASSVVAAKVANGPDRRTDTTSRGGLRLADIQQAIGITEAEGEEHQHEHLCDVTPGERALSLPSSSLLAVDGSGELGLIGRSARWGGVHDADDNGKSEGRTVWSKRWVLLSGDRQCPIPQSYQREADVNTFS